MIRITVESPRGLVVFEACELTAPWMGRSVGGELLPVQGREENGPLDDVLNLAQSGRWGLTL